MALPGSVGATPRPEEVPALLGHSRIDTTQVYASIRAPQLERAIAFYEAQAMRMLREWTRPPLPYSRNIGMPLEPGRKNPSDIRLVAPTGFEPIVTVRRELVVPDYAVRGH
jgi:hypothetical protein